MPVGILIVLIVALVIAGLIALHVADKAKVAKSKLESAVPLASQIETLIVSGDSSAAAETAAELQKKTSAARKAANDDTWRSVEWVPVAGPNLKAVRELSDVVDDLANNAIVPASKISIDAFKPLDGRINVDGVRAMGDTVETAEKSISSARAALAEIDRKPLMGQVSSAITKLDGTLKKADDVIGSVEGVVKVLPGALGADGPRHYLMMFQGNSEVRALGGNPASMALVEVRDGSIKITKQHSSTDFQNARAAPVAPLDPAVKHIYSDIIGRWVPNITSTPNFLTTVKLARAYWAELDDTHIDGVFSFDPVALSYLLKGTGPVKLATGDTLTGHNAVSLLLNQAYFKYSKGEDSDAFFAAAANSIFDVLTSGKADPKAMIPALVNATNEGRLMFWSENKAEEKIISTTRMAGVLPAKNDKSTVIGAYFNDVTGSKMDYYVKAKTSATSTQCTADAPKFSETATLSNVLEPSKASNLPAYITGPYYTPGDVGTDVVVYGAVGAKIDSWKASKSAKVKATGMIDGRPVSRILVKLAPGESVTLTYTMSGAKGKYGPLEMRTTPMVWPTPTTVSSPGCEAGK